MRKTYITPAATAVEIKTDSLLAASLSINNGGDTVGSADDAWSQHKGGWNSDAWSDAE